MQLPSDTSTVSPASATHSSLIQPSTLYLDSKILIVGGGTWGCSTALHLARRGYSNITVLDAHPIPSPIAAGNDINKILELSSSAPIGTDERYVSDKLAADAIGGWKSDPVFQGLFHETGCVMAATSEEGLEALNSGDGYNETNGWSRLSSKKEFQSTMPKGILQGEFPGWQGWWKSRESGCGWVHARKGIERAAQEAERLGVKFICGQESGRVVSLIYEDGDVKGVVTAYGPPIRADRTVVCAGANAAELFDMKDQLRPTAWTLAHIKLSREEAQLYKNLPVLSNLELGFFMEPDEEKCEIKICDEHPGYCNWETTPISSTSIQPEPSSKEKSVPFAYHEIPTEAETRVRRLLRETMPQLADRPLSFARICWCADTPDRAFLISRHPDYPSLILGVGGSGHGYSYIPAIGGVISDCLEDKMDPKMRERFKWRPETAVHRDWQAKQDRFGPEGSNHVMDFQDVTEWTNVQSIKS